MSESAAMMARPAVSQAMETAAPAPREPRRRTAIVDALRGWALLGVVLVNYALFYSFDAVIRVPAHDVTSRTMKFIVQLCFQTKEWTLLSVLFGYGFAMLIACSQETNSPSLRLFLRRMFWLGIIALVNSSFYYGDILKDYVLMGIVISLFHRASQKVFLFLTICGLLTVPLLIPLSRSVHLITPFADPPVSLYQSHHLFDVLRFGCLSGVHVLFSFPKYFDWNLVMLTCGFLGAYLQKSAFFEQLGNQQRLLRRALWISAVVVVALLLLHLAFVSLGWRIDRHYDAFIWFELSLMVCLTCILCRIFLKFRNTTFFRSFQSVGQMTLTNYLMQNVIGLLLFSGFGLRLLYKETYSFSIEVAIVVFCFQIWFSRWWLARHRWGPVEWLWRSLTYGIWLAN